MDLKSKVAQLLIFGVVNVGNLSCSNLNYSMIPKSDIYQTIKQQKGYVGGVEGLGAIGGMVSKETEKIGREFNLASYATVGNWGEHVDFIETANQENGRVYLWGHSSGCLEIVNACEGKEVDILVLADPTYIRNRRLGVGTFYKKIPRKVKKVYCILSDSMNMIKGGPLIMTDLENPRETKYENIFLNCGHLELVEEARKIFEYKMAEDLGR